MKAFQAFRTEIEQFLQRSGMPATTFGMSIAGDPSLVHDIRHGRMPSLRMVEKVNDFIVKYDKRSKKRRSS